MAQYDRMVLNHLLDTYENSLLFSGENKRTIQIEFRFTKQSIPAYFDESSTEYEKIHVLMKLLEEKGLIQIGWKNKKTDFLVQKVRLVPEKIEEAYQYVERKPKKNLEEENLLLLRQYLNAEATVTAALAAYLIQRLQKHQSVKKYIALENLRKTDDLLRACRLVEQNKTPCYIREFSITHFGDSKFFEDRMEHIAMVFREFSDGYADMSTSEILAEYGIYQTPNYVYLKGEFALEIGSTKVDLTLLKQGMGISGEDLTQLHFANLDKIKKVITIENLTSFFRYYEKDCLIIYLGGYHNSVRRNLLNMVHEAIPKAEYLHFGDIDAGGFSIFLDLRRKTGIPFVAYHMDLDTLKKYKQFGKKLSESDRKRLEKLSAQGEFRETIHYMLEENVKLEQECIGVLE